MRSRRMAMFCSQLKSLSPSSGPNPDQFENLANMRAHERGTGAEIWRQTGGEIDAFVMSAGNPNPNPHSNPNPNPNPNPDLNPYPYPNPNPNPNPTAAGGRWPLGILLGYPTPLCSATARHTGLLWRESPGVPALRA